MVKPNACRRERSEEVLKEAREFGIAGMSSRKTGGGESCRLKRGRGGGGGSKRGSGMTQILKPERHAQTSWPDGASVKAMGLKQDFH